MNLSFGTTRIHGPTKDVRDLHRSGCPGGMQAWGSGLIWNRRPVGGGRKVTRPARNLPGPKHRAEGHAALSADLPAALDSSVETAPFGTVSAFIRRQGRPLHYFWSPS
jgi:hypothetical protein